MYRRLIFWTAFNMKPSIEAADTDGRGRRVLTATGLLDPVAPTVDTQRNEVCWGDGGSAERSIQKVECISTNGKNRRNLYSGSSRHFSMAFFQGAMYWTSPKENTVHRISIDGGNATTVHSRNKESSGVVHSISAVPNHCPMPLAGKV